MRAWVCAWLGAVAMVAGPNAWAQQATDFELQVNVLGLQNSDGQVVANLFLEGDDVFGTPRWRATHTIADKRASVAFTHLPAGRYALIVFHDVNGNNTLDHNVFHFPAEPLGFSNGFSLGVLSGMPDSHKLAFTLGPDTQPLNISVR